MNFRNLKIINFSNVKLNKNQITLLEKGCSFNIGNSFSALDTFLHYQKYLRKISLALYFEENPLTTQDQSIISSPSNFFPKEYIPQFMLKQENDIIKNIIEKNDNKKTNNNKNTKTLHSLEKMRNVRFTKADKCGTIIMFNKENYDSLVFKHLHDKNTYNEVTDKFHDDAISKLKSLVEKYKHCLTKKEFFALNKTDIKYCHFRILPKIHKSAIIEKKIFNERMETYVEMQIPDDLNTRPIVNNNNCITENLSQMLDHVLKPYITSLPSFIKDTKHFLNEIPKFISETDLFCTYDVVSLYTTIPHNLGLSSVSYFIEQFPDKLSPRFSKDCIIEFLSFVLNNCYISYNKSLFHQIKGCAMGTKVAPTYACLTMGFLENNMYKICKEINLRFSSKFYRFIDDCFVILKNREDAILFFEVLNTLNPHIKFTDTTHFNYINFLDVSLMKTKSGIIETDIFYKKTHTFSFLHFHSRHPHHIKVNIPYTVFNRINRIVSDQTLKFHRFKEVFKIFSELKYPEELLVNAINKTLNHQYYYIHEKKNEKIITYSLPYNKCNVEMNKNIFSKNNEILQNMHFNNTKFLRTYKLSPNIMTKLLVKRNTSYNVLKCKKLKCKTCPTLISYKKCITINNKTIFINSNCDCCSNYIIYVLLCPCGEKYVGSTTNQLHIRMNLHRNQIERKEYTILPFSEHIQNCGKMFQCTIIYKCGKEDSKYILFIEHYFKSLLNIF